MAALLSGQGVSGVASAYKLPVGTVKGWHSRMKDRPPEAQVVTEKKEAIGDLLINYLHTNLATLQKQSEIFADREWLMKQNAADVAVLHGVITDKTIRLLDALGNVGNGNP